MAYEKIFETRILRIKHKITFTAGTRAFDLKEMLKSVPDKAIVNEVYDDDYSDDAYIMFHEEKQELMQN